MDQNGSPPDGAPGGGSRATDASRGTKIARTAGIVFGVIVVLVLATALVFAVRFRSLLDPETLADRLEPRIERAVNRPVSIDGASLRLWPRPAVRVEGIRVGNRGIFSETPLASANQVILEPRLLPLLRRQIVIDRVLVRSPRALLQVAEDGTSNFGDFVPERTGTEGAEETSVAPGVSLDVRRIEIEDGRAGYRDAMNARSVQAGGVDLRLDVDAGATGSIGLSGSAQAEEFTIRSARLPGGSIEVPGASIEGDGRISADLKTLELDRAEVRAGAFAARLSGRVDSLGSPVRSLDLALFAEGLGLADLVSETESGLQPDGEVELDLRLRGEAGPEHRPEATGLATLRNGSVRAPGGEPIATDLEVQARLEEGAANVTAEGDVLGGTMDATGVVALDSVLGYAFDVQADGRLDRMLAAMPRDPGRVDEPLPDVDGRLELAVRIEGEATSPDRRSVDGTAMISDLVVTSHRLRAPIRADRVPLRIEGESIAWTDVEIEVGGDRGTTSGRAEQVLSSRESQRMKPVLRAGFAFDRLDLDDVLAERPEQGIGWGRLLIAHLGGSSIQGETPEQLAAGRGQSRPVELPFTGSLDASVGSLTLGGTEFTGLEGSARIDRQRIEVPELSFRAYGGTGSLAGTLELGAGYIEPFGLRLVLQGVRAEEWLTVHTPLGRLVSGTMGLDLELAGGLDTLLLPGGDSLTGDGTIRVRDGTIALNPLTRSLATALGAADPTNGRLMSWISRFRVDDGALYFPDGRLVFENGDVDLDGSVGFNGALALDLTLRPDAEQVAAASDRLMADLPPSMRSMLTGGGPVELVLRVGGSVGQPTVSLDPSMADRALESAQDAGRSEIERRGLDLLRRLTGAAEDTAATPAGAAADSASGSRP